jgi:hypothetical protein
VSEPNDRDREVAQDVAECVCDMLTSRSLYEPELLTARDDCGPAIAAYREEVVLAERRRCAGEVGKLVMTLRSLHPDAAIAVEALIAKLREGSGT